MEEKSKLWLWILAGVLGVVVIGIGVWLGLNQDIVRYMRENGVSKTVKDVFFNKNDLKETEFFVGALSWDDQGAVISFTRDGQRGEFAINFKETRVALAVPVSGEGRVEEKDLLSTLSPYWKNAFCMGDTLLMEVETSAIKLKKDIEKLESKDVVKITNLGPSKCREEN